MRLRTLGQSWTTGEGTSRKVLSIRQIGSLPCLAMSAAIVVLACPAGDPADEPPAELPPESATAAAPLPWYRRVRTLDLTGDGQADSVRLEAVGARPDSLRLTLSLVVDGLEKHREAWGSSYELALLDSADRASPQASS